MIGETVVPILAMTETTNWATNLIHLELSRCDDNNE